MEALLKKELEILSREGLADLSKEELKELRMRITAALPKKHQLALLSGNKEEGMSQEEYDRFVSIQLQLYKQDRIQKSQQAVQEPVVQATG